MRFSSRIQKWTRMERKGRSSSVLLLGTSGVGQQCHEALKQVSYFGLGPRTKLRERPLEVGYYLVDWSNVSVQGTE